MKAPALLRILLRDWPLGWALLTALSLALLAAALLGNRGGGGSFWWLGLSAALLVVSAGIVLKRLLLVTRLLNAGPRLSGRILRRSGHREGLRQALVAYAVGKRVYQSLISVAGCPASFRPLPGDDVAIVVDPQQPTRAFFLQRFL